MRLDQEVHLVDLMWIWWIWCGLDQEVHMVVEMICAHTEPLRKQCPLERRHPNWPALLTNQSVLYRGHLFNFNLHSLHYSRKIYMWKNLWLWFRLWFAPMKGLMLGFQQKEKAEQVRLRSRAKIFSNSVAAIAQLPDLLDSDLFSRCSQGCVLFGLYRGGQSQG